MENKIYTIDDLNKIYTIDDLNKAGIHINDSGNTFFNKLNLLHNRAIIVEIGDFFTIIAKNGEKIIYNINKLKTFTPELIEIIIADGDSPEKIDEIVDNFNGRDTFGIVINKNGNPKSPSEYRAIIDNPQTREQFYKTHNSRNRNTENDDMETR